MGPRIKACPQEQLHTKRQPEGYLQWHAWADAKSKTHVQKRCPGCGLFAIWVPKRAALSKQAITADTHVKGNESHGGQG